MWNCGKPMDVQTGVNMDSNTCAYSEIYITWTLAATWTQKPQAGLKRPKQCCYISFIRQHNVVLDVQTC